jgi:hypothetical protein
VHKSHFGLYTISRVRGKVPTYDTFLGLATSTFDVSKNMYRQGLYQVQNQHCSSLGPDESLGELCCCVLLKQIAGVSPNSSISYLGFYKIITGPRSYSTS